MSSKLTLDIGGLNKHNPPKKNLLWTSKQGYVYWLPDYSKIDQEHFATIFSLVPWDLIDNDGDIEISWAMWKVLFLSAIDESVPN